LINAFLSLASGGVEMGILIARQLAFVLAVSMSAIGYAEDARIELAGSMGEQTVDVLGLNESQLAAVEKLPEAERAALLEVFVDGAANAPGLGGTVAAVEKAVRFTPRYPLEPGVTYRATFHAEKLGQESNTQPVSATLPLAERTATPTTVVEHIYPTADVLPENQLKFYLHFSAPMSRGEAYRHIHLLDADGKELDAAFLELGEELWDAEQQRFTLLLDPGRVKRGLKPREELGPVLVAGNSYTLVVDSAWRDATRTPLNSGARKDFSVGPPDDTPIDPQTWQITAPEAESNDPLLVRFGQSLDHSLLERIVWVVDPAGEKVPGSIQTGDGEACWQFTSQRPWTPGTYKIVAETTLEDLAGNSIGRPFELDEFKPVQKRIETKTIEIPVEVK
jgi:hypothetical protein